MRLLSLLLALASAPPAFCQVLVTTLPESPHRAMEECVACHDVYMGEPDPHQFVRTISAICLQESCHTVQHIGRSHPVDVSLNTSKVIDVVPELLPLEEGRVSCGSCHQPHGEWLSTAPCYPKQPPKVYLVTQVGEEVRQTPYYTTYFLRVVGDPGQGFTALCNSCHPK